MEFLKCFLAVIAGVTFSGIAWNLLIINNSISFEMQSVENISIESQVTPISGLILGTIGCLIASKQSSNS